MADASKTDHRGALVGPVVAWVAIYVVIILVKFVDGTQFIFDTGVFLVYVSLAMGAWAGTAVVQRNGGPFDIATAGAIVGLVHGSLGLIELFVHKDSTDPAPSPETVLAVMLVFIALNLIGAIVGGGWLYTQSSSTRAANA